MVLADDHFATIVHAVEEGRRIYDNIRRVVRYLLTTNSGEIWVMMLAPLLGLPVPLLPVQILWINLVTDGPPAIALALEPPEPDVLRRPPRSPQESVLGRGLWQQALGVGLAMAAITIGVQAAARAAGWDWRTMVFTVLALLQLGNALAMRAESRSALREPVGSNPWLLIAVAAGVAAQLALVYVPPFHDVFGTRSLGGVQMAVVLTASSGGFWIAEALKWRGRRRGSPSPGTASFGRWDPIRPPPARRASKHRPGSRR